MTGPARPVMGPLALAAGYGADLLLGDPTHLHPVAGFGTLAMRVERSIHRPRRAVGALAVTGLVGGTAAAAEGLARVAERRHPRTGRAVILAALTWTAVGGRSLRSAAQAVETPLLRGDVDTARRRLRSLCGRDAATLGPSELRAGVIESLAENSSDAIVAPLLWGALLGPAGVAGYRAANTLDAMWGHRSPRYLHFGWAAARLDDVLNWPAARLTAALAVLIAPSVGGARSAAWRTWRRDAAAHPSPNAGPVEAAWAGALGVRLGGPLAYAGRVELRPTLGEGPDPGPAEVVRAAELSRRVGALALAVSCAVAYGRAAAWA